jgi:ubiquinone/menaquinone biosynthesis C-methylase UbiE
MKQRNQFPDPQVDQLETAWWNENAEIIEEIWAQPLTLRRAVREGYLQRAKNFFLEEKAQLPITVLEIGCGSGWVGRLLAERSKLNIIGIDISEQQIALANQNAAKEGLSDTCEYRCQNLAVYTSQSDHNASGAFMQAILHHLTWSEIHTVLAQIAALGAGTRVFLYKPVYLGSNVNKMSAKAQVARVLLSALMKIPKVLTVAITVDQRQHINNTRKQQAVNLARHATQNGWVLSPKEVCFGEAELISTLNQYFDVKNSYLCNFTSVAAAQTASFYDNPAIHERFNRLILPFAQKLDAYLFKSGLLARASSQYVFMGYECFVK